MKLTVYGVPIPQGSMKAFMPKGGRFPVVTADNKKTKPWRQAIIDSALSYEGLEGIGAGVPLLLYVAFFLPRPKSAAKSVLWPAKKPDLDKLVRAVCDGLTASGVWHDDSQVVRIRASKRFAGGQFDKPDGLPRAEIEVTDAR